MTVTSCEHENEAALAAATGTMPAWLAAHLESCPACADTALVAAALQAEARADLAQPLPEAAAVWRAALRDRRQQALARATLPITVMTRVALGTTTVAAAAGLIRLWPTVADQFAAFARALAAPAAPTPGGTAIALFSLAVVATLSAAFALFETWAGE
jgi:hypothetical protein